MKLFEPTTLIIILVIVLVIFGPSRLPQLGKSLGKTMKALRDGVEGKEEEGAEDQKAASTSKEEDEEPAEKVSDKV